MDWVCSDAWRGPLTQTMFSMGALFGCLIFGILSDKFGRYPTFFITNVINLVFGIIISYCHNYTSFIAVRFLAGLSNPTFFNTLYILGKSGAMCCVFRQQVSYVDSSLLISALEYVSVERRSIIGNVGLAIGYSLGGITQPYILKAIGNWRIFHQVIFAQGAMVFISPL